MSVSPRHHRRLPCEPARAKPGVHWARAAAMRVAAIVESRMTSKRLPGKNLKPILGRPMVSRLFERLKRCRRVDIVCLATSTHVDDDVLERQARDDGVSCFRGSLEDVLDRTLGAARSLAADLIVEITGDCPLVDPQIVDAAVQRYCVGGYDYVANILDHLTFPVGFDVQVYSTASLAEVDRIATEPYDRNNVTPYFYRHPERYRLLNLAAPPELDRPRYRLCVDYPEDFAVITEVFEALYPSRNGFGAREIVSLLDTRPDLVARNTWRDDAFTWPSSGGAAHEEVLALS